ncbi:MAG: hypothetical protein N2316_10830 [Spirochaetes bacterium]|nr:hypothetical protein [Spirochaetota bacterium]
MWDKPINIAPNEARIDLFRPFIEKIGGGYVGVGSLQNFVLASWAKSERIWIIDCTKRIVASNFINIAFLHHAKCYKGFRKLWSAGRKGNVREIIRQISLPPYIDFEYCMQTWEIGLHFTNRYFTVLDEISQRFGFFTCFNNQSLYEEIRTKALKNKITILAGRLEGTRAIARIANYAKRHNIVIRIIYFSNAEEYFREYPLQFIQNVRILPVDEKTIALRTVSLYRQEFPWATFSERLNSRGFHYNAMRWKIFIENLKNGTNVFSVLKYAHGVKTQGLCVAY